MKLSIGFVTDPGPRKGNNQDSLIAAIPDDQPEMALLVISDGMGGARGGEIASQQTVRIMQELLLDASLPTPDDAHQRLEEAITAANTLVYRMGNTSPDMQGMGCTVVAALVIGDQYWIANVGDSRAYLIRERVSTQITQDHTWVGQQLREGIITEEQAVDHSLRHVLDRAIGAEAQVEIDINPIATLQSGDSILLCSDGLHGVLSDATLADVVSEHSAQDAADQLMRYALSAPARDNVSVIILRAE
jgi:protein phosphatase